MRRAAKIDVNQPEIVKALRQLGAAVMPLHAVGEGVPDLLVSHITFFPGNTPPVVKRTFLIEVKDGSKPPSERRLTPDQIRWHAAWKGEIFVVETIDQAIATLKEKSCSHEK